MICGVKFCGGCNPRYDRGEAFKKIKEHFTHRVDFVIAEEGKTYDFLLIIGGCTNCCASYKQYNWKTEVIKMWDEKHLPEVIEKIERIISN
ncbi:hypothetical protein [Anaerovorax odorimutans]|uniref:hypothetical protein n=1 Tax=Anaerovorax odorimutans TaxID=109327 RepID=UPI00041EFB8E|nr:hypothetical protein [Anaerovorax odorimutans]